MFWVFDVLVCFWYTVICLPVHRLSPGSLSPGMAQEEGLGDGGASYLSQPSRNSGSLQGSMRAGVNAFLLPLGHQGSG